MPFTPGPWKWQVHAGVAYLRSIRNITRDPCPEFDGLDPIIDDGSAGGEYTRTIEPDSPNAILIEHAPELYAVLEKVAPVITFILMSVEMPALRSQAFKSLDKEISAVLAKARNEQPIGRPDDAH